MGCDIHFVVERRHKERAHEGWIGLYATDALPDRGLAARRDYDFFAEVASVRGSRSPKGYYARGLPRDISALAWEEYTRWGSDAHSVSHLPAQDFAGAWLRVQIKDGGDAPKNHWGAPITEKSVLWSLLGCPEDDRDNEYRVVFWFDN